MFCYVHWCGKDEENKEKNHEFFIFMKESYQYIGLFIVRYICLLVLTFGIGVTCWRVNIICRFGLEKDTTLNIVVSSVI